MLYRVITTMFNDVLELLTITYTVDALGQQLPQETAETIFCRLKSIPSQEYFNTAKQGIKSRYIFIVKQCDYNDQIKVRYKNKIYHVYRTYEIDREEIELYVEIKGGE